MANPPRQADDGHMMPGLDKSTGMVYIECKGTAITVVPFHSDVKEEAIEWDPGNALVRCSG
jgi:hypothetical protein